MADIALQKINGYYDFSFERGDFKVTNGLDTALLMSIFCEKRADASEIPMPENRRGWWGNLVLNYDNYEIGSKLWLLEQARRDNITLNLTKTYTADCLQWLINDNLAQSIKADSNFISGGIQITIEIDISANKTLNVAYDLWLNTTSF